MTFSLQTVTDTYGDTAEVDVVPSPDHGDVVEIDVQDATTIDGGNAVLHLTSVQARELAAALLAAAEEIDPRG